MPTWLPALPCPGCLPATLQNPPAKEAVATVSSCSHFPWMMEVWPLRDWLSTAFHTLLHNQKGRAGRASRRGKGQGIQKQQSCYLLARVQQQPRAIQAMHNCAQLLSSAPQCSVPRCPAQPAPALPPPAPRLAVRPRPAAQPPAPDPRACGVHDLHLPLRQQQHLLHAGAKGGQDDHLPLLHIAKVLAAVLCGLNELHIHLLQALVPACVVGSRGRTERQGGAGQGEKQASSKQT